MRNPNCTILSDNLDKAERIIPPHIKTKMSQASGLMLLNAILMGVVVVIGAYAPRYRRHPVIGAVFLGATALFLPIVTTTVNTSVTTYDSFGDLVQYALKYVGCSSFWHLSMVFLWTGIVVVIGINTSAVVAGDAREGRNLSPPIILLVKASWSAYLTISNRYLTEEIVQLFVIMFAKLLLKYTAFYMARQSFALGRSPRLIAGYMAQLQQPVHDEHTPALIVMGEDKVKVEEQPHGYSLKKQGDTARTNRNRLLVTLDRVLGLDEDDMGTLQTSSTAQHAIPQPTISARKWSLKHNINNQQGKQKLGDLCFSFALFKLLRCRFAKYTVSEAGFIQTSKFFRKTLLQGDDYERVFGIIRDELSFINDYYFSSLPIYYSHPLVPAFGVTLSLWSIGYSLYLAVGYVDFTLDLFKYGDPGQIYCWQILNTQDCGDVRPTVFEDGYFQTAVIGLGSLYYDIVPLYLAIAVLVLAEAREIVSYICSNWTKVALICHHVNQDWWQRSRVVKKCIFFLLKYRRCKLVNNWDDKMKQCSILELHPRKIPLLPHRLLRSLVRTKKVDVPSTVKTAIFETLKVNGESFTNDQCIGPPSSPLSLYGCSGRQPGYTILVWHIATSVFEVFYQSKTSEFEVSQLPQLPSDHKTVAIHLSRYCTYLVTSRPELLPDDAEWCSKLYDQVKKDADHVLAKVQGVDDHNQLIQALSADSNHEVLRNGARLGQELVKDSAIGWEKLARFWVEMILYVAPSENLEAHTEAISQGGELITLLWAMLAHAGITGRLSAEEGSGFC